MPEKPPRGSGSPPETQEAGGHEEVLAGAIAALAGAAEGLAEAGKAFKDGAKRLEALLAAAPPGNLGEYRTIAGAVDIGEINHWLGQGWDLLHLDYCEEVRSRRGVGGAASVMAWVPYAVIGKRQRLVSSDLGALAQASEERAFMRGTPLAAAPAEEEGEGEPQAEPGEEGQQGQDPNPGASPPTQPIGTPRGRTVTPHRTAAPPSSKGFQGTGGLDR